MILVGEGLNLLLLIIKIDNSVIFNFTYYCKYQGVPLIPSYPLY